MAELYVTSGVGNQQTLSKVPTTNSKTSNNVNVFTDKFPALIKLNTNTDIGFELRDNDGLYYNGKNYACDTKWYDVTSRCKSTSQATKDGSTYYSINFYKAIYNKALDRLLVKFSIDTTLTTGKWYIGLQLDNTDGLFSLSGATSITTITVVISQETTDMMRAEQYDGSMSLGTTIQPSVDIYIRNLPGNDHLNNFKMLADCSFIRGLIS